MERPSGGTAGVVVGKKVELSDEDRRYLAQLTSEMHRLASTQRAGWFGLYVATITRANRIIHEAVRRSHAS